MKKTLFLLVLLIFIVPVNAMAGTLVSKSGTGYYNTPTFDSIRDGYVVQINRSQTDTIVVTSFMSDFNSDVREVKEYSVSRNAVNPTLVLRCNVSYDIQFLYQGALVGNIKYIATSIANPTCLSDVHADNDEFCADSICHCIADLKGVNEDIKGAVESNGETLTIIKETIEESNVKLDNINSAVNTVNQSINDFADEFKTGKNYTVKDLPPVLPLLDQNKPMQPQNSFTDNNTYFQDMGDDPTPIGKLPSAPEPADNWDGVTRENELTPEKELEKDDFIQTPEMEKETEMEITPFEKDREMELETFEKSPLMKKETWIKDKPLEITPFQKTEQFNKNHEYEKNHIYDQTNKLYESEVNN